MRSALVSLVVGSLAVGACNDAEVVPIEPGGCGLAITKIRITHVDKLDLLIVVDNSSSMADKQAELARQLPEMLRSLTDPTPDPRTGRSTTLMDVHVGVITSSLGSHGTSACAVAVTNMTNDDRAHLLPRAGDVPAEGCPTAVIASPLSWVYQPEFGPSATFKGVEGATLLATSAACIVASAREQGCGYEAPWEAMYHFLVDPFPYAKAEARCTLGVSGDTCSGAIVVEGLDEELLAQRRAFLRPNSLLSVVILSDENDASLRPAGQNWLPWATGRGAMRRGFKACESVPDDFEPESSADFARLHDEFKCRSCAERADDPNCALPWASDPLNRDIDDRNLRAWQMTQRFGYNFLWGRQRYVDAFTKGQVSGSDGKLGPNPIFSGGYRTQDLIVVGTIVGVPRRLVSNADGTPKELTMADWDLIQGPVGKRDPQMFEQIAPRTQAGPDGATVPKFLGDRSVNYSAATGGNGGDRDIVDGDDLQYACIEERSAPGANNDCSAPDAATKNPLCAADGSQPFFKAYPGLRHLRIAKDLGISGYVASICSRSYVPVIRGITDKLKATLNAQCIRTSLTPNPDGTVDCRLHEVLRHGDDHGKRCEELAKGLCTPGAAPCRRAGTDRPPISVEQAAAELRPAITVFRSDGTAAPTPTPARVENGNVYVRGHDGISETKQLVCELEQLTGQQLTACINEEAFTTDRGFCYSQVPVIVGPQCQKLGAPGTIRFFGGSRARNGSELFTQCGNLSGCP